MSVPTQYWGESLWKIMYSIAYSLPAELDVEQQEHVVMFYTSLSSLLPCEECKTHYHEYLIKNPLSDGVIKTNTTLLIWINNLHNSINEKLHKPVILLKDKLKELQSTKTSSVPFKQATGFGVRKVKSTPRFNRSGCTSC